MIQNNGVTSIHFKNNFLSNSFCDDIISKISDVGHIGRTINNETKIRKVKIHSFHENDESIIIQEVLKYIDAINQTYFKFDLNGMIIQDRLNLFEYNIGDKYDWHFDMGHDVLSTRKLSFSIQLSDEKSYDGGNLEFLPSMSCDFIRQKGTLCVFPSYWTHRVTEITQGTRYCIVGWVHGNSYK